LFCIFDLYAENHLNGKSNPNYKNLKVYAKVLERSGESDFYLIQIDIVNTGDSTVSFWETTSNYVWIFGFSAFGVVFINQNQRLNIEKKITDSQGQKAVQIKVKIIPHSKYTIKTQFYIFNKEKFLKTKNNFRVVFIYNDADLQLMEDMKQIICEDSIVYKW
jgi:hypothetical protein